MFAESMLKTTPLRSDEVMDSSLMSDPAPKSFEPAPRPQISLVSSAAEPYRRLAEIFHDVLSEENPTALLARIADTLAELIPYEDVHIYEADEVKRILIPVLARSQWADQVMSEIRSQFVVATLHVGCSR